MTREDMERLWGDHLAGEFASKDLDAVMATMVDEPSVNHMPVNTGGQGREAVRSFYRDVFIPSWPDDLQVTPVNRVVGDSQIVDEIHMRFTHSKQMDWFLPGVPATGRVVEVDFVVIVGFRDGKVAFERIYWDNATVMRQLGLL